MNRDREAIARAIDPQAFDPADECFPLLKKAALAAADRVLALPVGGGVEAEALARAEAHAERLAGALEGVLPASRWTPDALRNHMAPGTIERITEARQALSAYRGEMK